MKHPFAPFRILQEYVLEAFLVHRQILTLGVRIVLVEAELDVAVDDTGHQPGVDRFPIALALDQLQHGVRYLLVQMLEQVAAPGHQRQLVDLVHILTALLALALHPMPVQVGADTVQHLARELILLPALGVEAQHFLVHQIDPILVQPHEVVLEKLLQPFVQLLADQLGPARRCADAFFRYLRRARARVGLLVDTRTVIVDMSERVEIGSIRRDQR